MSHCPACGYDRYVEWLRCPSCYLEHYNRLQLDREEHRQAGKKHPVDETWQDKEAASDRAWRR